MVKVVSSRTQEAEAEFEEAVAGAVEWLRTRPQRDALDAAYAVVCTRASWLSKIGTAEWPTFVAAVREAAQ